MCAAALLTLCGSVTAAPREVNVRIEGKRKTLFEGPILSEGHAVSSYKADGGNAAEDLAEHPCDGINPLDPENTAAGPTPTAAAVDAMSAIGETQAMAGQWYPGFDDYFVKQWGSGEEDAEAEGRSWGILVNNVFTNVGGCQYELNAGDEVLWAYNAFAFRPLLALFAVEAHYAGGGRPLTATAKLGTPFDVEVLAYEDDAEDSPPAHPERVSAEPFAGALVAPVSTTERGFESLAPESPGTVTTNAEGKAQITFTTPGWHRLKAGAAIDSETHEEEAIRSNRLDVCVPPPGESACGELPLEDRVRVSPRYVSPPRDEGNGEAPPAPAGGRQTPSGGPGAAGATPGVVGTFAAGPSRLTPALRVRSLGARRLLLRVSAPGVVTVKLARSVRAGPRTRWRAVKTLRIKAAKAGTLRIGLPRLSPGSYRASIALDGSPPAVGTFVVHRGGR